MALDLSKIKALVEDDFMVDTCVVTRNEEGTEDENWDAVTMTYTGGDPDAEVYSGKCYISMTNTVQEIEEGGQLTSQTRYYLNIPLESPDTTDGDICTVLSSLNNPDLVGETFVLRDEETGTYKVKRRIHMVRVTPTVRG